MGNQKTGRRTVKIMSAVLGVAAACSACTAGTGTANPEQALSQAISGIKGKSAYAFQGKSELKIEGTTYVNQVGFEGYVQNNRLIQTSGLPQTAAAGSSEPGAAWSPMQKLEQFEQSAGRVRENKELSRGGVTVLDLELTPEESKNEWSSRTAALQQTPEERVASFRKMHRLSDKEADAMKQELQAATQDYQTELQDMLRTLSVQTLHRIWIDNATSLPKKLETRSTLRYETAGTPREETTTDSYEFREASGGLLPSSQAVKK
ncbi:hypothetical protein [Paenibacillus sp. y28]|uniref:hypothetical protein n=1 Tax=Paenibacillus sp. y28 TaxID=3129110 RepID=UPI003019445B